MKKIAIPTRKGQVDAHFGHCEYYTIYSVEENKLLSEETYEAPQGCGCKSNVATILAEKGIKLMLAGNMGTGALNVLNSCGIEVLRGRSGNVREVLDSYLQGNLKDNGLNCAHHEHKCSH